MTPRGAAIVHLGFDQYLRKSKPDTYWTKMQPPATNTPNGSKVPNPYSSPNRSSPNRRLPRRSYSKSDAISTRRIATPPWCPISTTYGPGAKSCVRGDKSAPPPPVMAKLRLAASSGVGGEGMGASGGEYVFPFYYFTGRRIGSENGVCIIVRPLNTVLPPFRNIRCFSFFNTYVSRCLLVCRFTYFAFNIHTKRCLVKKS
jgi:hypothetical protein